MIAHTKSFIMDRVYIGEGTNGRHTVIRSIVPKKTQIEEVTAIADDIVISARCRLFPSNIYPHQNIPKGKFEGSVIRPNSSPSQEDFE